MIWWLTVCAIHQAVRPSVMNDRKLQLLSDPSARHPVWLTEGPFGAEVNKHFTNQQTWRTECLILRQVGESVAPRVHNAFQDTRSGEYVLALEFLEPVLPTTFNHWPHQQCIELGKLLRRLHNCPANMIGPHSATQSPIGNGSDWASFLRQYVKCRVEFLSLHDQSVLNGFRTTIARLFSSLTKVTEPPRASIIHRDVRPQNLGRSRRDGQLRIFDFEHVWGGDGIFDLAMIWMEHTRERQAEGNNEFLECLWSAYDSPITRGYFDEVALPIYATIRSLGAIAFGYREHGAEFVQMGIKGVEEWGPNLPA